MTARRLGPWEIVVMWATRIAIAPLAAVFGWSALKRFLHIAPEDQLSPVAVGPAAAELVMAALLVWAVFYPAPPWKNEPLKRFGAWVFWIVVVVAWWFGSWWTANEVNRAILGYLDLKPGDGVQTLFAFLVWVALNALLYRIFKWGERSFLRIRGLPEKPFLCPRCTRESYGTKCKYCGD